MKLIIRTTITLGAVAFLALGVLYFGRYQSPNIDRVNPFVESTVSYVEITPGAVNVRGAEPVDADGAARDYRLDFTAWGADGRFVLVHHKGTHVSSIEYLPSEQLPTPVRRVLENSNEGTAP